jgi:hypothetical protein
MATVSALMVYPIKGCVWQGAAPRLAAVRVPSA